MNVILPKNINKSDLVDAHDILSGKVYQFGHLFAAESENNNGVVVIDSNDSDVICFNNTADFAEWLDDNDYPTKGELTGYQMQISIK
ncbi:hypothetical protein PJM38_0003 [Salmonella phage vB_SenS_UTK0010]|uniref:Uncharacterized protein n=1 Tax=Salmonella phage vB_SenS_UTK0010 TaxID=3028909 RepID=A0AAF0CIL4_9CAUD|nr:hypothetical protein PJM38_0003 [Salmonella phage vB_SenS_UTK0010]